MPLPRSAPQLETARLILRAHRAEDFADCAAMWADPAVVRYISGTPSTPEESWARLLRYGGHWALMGFGYWVVQSKADGHYLGEVGLVDYKRDLDPPLGPAPEAGWVLTSAAHGQGYATEAVRRILDWADETLPAETTVCIFDPDHHASVNVARKLGYAETGTATYHGNPALVMSRPRGGVQS